MSTAITIFRNQSYFSVRFLGERVLAVLVSVYLLRVLASKGTRSGLFAARKSRREGTKSALVLLAHLCAWALGRNHHHLQC